MQHPPLSIEDLRKWKSSPSHYLGYYPEKYWNWDACMQIMALVDDPKSFFYTNDKGEFRWNILKKYLGRIEEVLLMPGMFPRLYAPIKDVYYEPYWHKEEPGPEPPVLGISSIDPVENNVILVCYSENIWQIYGQGFKDGEEVLVEVVKWNNLEIRHDPVHPIAFYMRVLSENLIEIYGPKWGLQFYQSEIPGYLDLTLKTFPTTQYPEGREAVMTNALYFWGYNISWPYKLDGAFGAGVVEGMIAERRLDGNSWRNNFQSPYAVQEIQLENRDTGELFDVLPEDFEIENSDKIRIIIRTEYA